MRASDNKFIKYRKAITHELLKQTNTAPERTDQITETLADEPARYYVVTNEASLIADKIKTDDMPYTAFAGIPDGTVCAIIEKDDLNSIVYVDRDGDKLSILHLFMMEEENSQMSINHAVMRIDVVNNYWHGWEDKKEQKHYEEIFRLAIAKLLIYIFLSDIIVEMIPAGESNGKSRKNGKILNDLKTPISVVGSKWNSYVIRIGDFRVAGHFRLQPHGPGMTLRRLVYIKPFMKHGYKRRGHV